MKTTTRIAIVDDEKCKPNKCNRECEKYCPVNGQGKQCITHENKLSVIKISEILCTGCNICTKKCPFDAIKIINLPAALGSITHKYSENGFRLYGLPMPEKDSVLGLVGANGCGKSTALMILIGKLLPNMGMIDDKNLKGKPIKKTKKKDRHDLNLKYRGTNIQNYLKDLDNGLRIAFKPQNISSFRKTDIVDDLIKESVIQALDLKNLCGRTCEHLSDGELQRVAIGITLSKDCDIMVFDEPCTYLDIHQRMIISRLIRESKATYKIVIEHDFTALDYMADKICLLYGESGGYGNVTLPLTTSEGLNSFLDGYINYSNTRFRPYKLDFKFSREESSEHDLSRIIRYSAFEKSYPNFTMKAQAGHITMGTICVLLGPNGSGKTTFIKAVQTDLSNFSIAYKTQDVYSSENKASETVIEYLMRKTDHRVLDRTFQQEVVKPLKIQYLMDNLVDTLSGGERQKVEIIATLGQNAQLYLIDEPSCFLDIESILVIARILKHFAVNRLVSIFVVEHDFNLGLFLADSVLLFQPQLIDRDGKFVTETTITDPLTTKVGYNTFLRNLGVTMRQDHETLRPRINKFGSQNDIVQKQNGSYIESCNEITHPSFKISEQHLDW